MIKCLSKLFPNPNLQVCNYARLVETDHLIKSEVENRVLVGIKLTIDSQILYSYIQVLRTYIGEKYEA